MEIFMADTASPQAADVLRNLEDHGHLVHSCGNHGEPGESPCAVLRGDVCPLEARTVDVAVGVGPVASVDRLGDGEVCAIRRRVPLVLLDRPHDPLARWAAAVAPASQALEVINEINAAVLPEHTAEARRTVREWLGRRGLDDTAVDVEVRRRHGTLRLALFVDGRIPEREAKKLAVYVAQGLGRFDPWAKGIDTSFHHVIQSDAM
jgi:hypothetical protein